MESKVQTAESVKDIVADLLQAEPEPTDVVLTNREVVHAVAEGVLAMLDKGFTLKQVRERLLDKHGVEIGERSLRAHLRDAGIGPKGRVGRRVRNRGAQTTRKKTTSDGGRQQEPAREGASRSQVQTASVPSSSNGVAGQVSDGSGGAERSGDAGVSAPGSTPEASSRPAGPSSDPGVRDGRRSRQFENLEYPEDL